MAPVVTDALSGLQKNAKNNLSLLNDEEDKSFSIKFNFGILMNKSNENKINSNPFYGKKLPKINLRIFIKGKIWNERASQMLSEARVF